MSTVIAKNVQIGTSGTATDNFTIFQPATPDGTLRIGNGNTGITTSQVALTSAGNVGIGTSSPGYRLDVSATSFIAASVSTSYSGAGNIRIADASTTSASAPYIGSVGDNLTFGRIGTAEYARITSAGLFQFNSGYGSVATAYGCRAWVNFNGTGTVAIRASGNVSSITDNGTGNYRVNFTTSMPDTNYSAMLTGGQGTANGVDDASRLFRPTTGGFATSSYQFGVVNAAENAFVDANIVEVVVFR